MYVVRVIWRVADLFAPRPSSANAISWMSLGFKMRHKTVSTRKLMFVCSSHNSGSGTLPSTLLILRRAMQLDMLV